MQLQGTSNMHVQGPQINQFNNISPNPIPRSSFQRDFTRRSTFNQDYLVPIFVDEILPGDDINLRMTAFTRVATPIKPIMDNLYMETFWFFVPNRLVWNNWEKFQGMQIDPGDSVDYTIPVLDHTVAPLSTTGFAVESIYDYLGLPTLVTDLANISALFNRGIDLIWNTWFRDENLQDSLVVPTDDGPDDPATYALRKRNKRKDYITSCLPWPQKGAAVTVPIGGTAPVNLLSTSTNAVLGLRADTHASVGVENTIQVDGDTDNKIKVNTAPFHPMVFDPNGTLYADLDAATTTTTLNLLRQAALYQQILELDARGGTRYVESLYSRFGVISPDFRLQRPELLGQGSTRINIYAVPQTNATGATGTPQGNLAAFGTSVINGDHGCRYSATEHGMLIGLANVRADLTYQQGIPKMFSRQSRLDFYEPMLNGLGEQAVLNKELYAQGTSDDELVFGYQERFAEYRFKNSEITGKFRSTDPTSLDVWHLSQEFGALPVLNSSFITEAVPMSRVVAVTTEPSFLFDAAFSYTHVRPMPIRSNPGITRL